MYIRISAGGPPNCRPVFLRTHTFHLSVDLRAAARASLPVLVFCGSLMFEFTFLLSVVTKFCIRVFLLKKSWWPAYRPVRVRGFLNHLDLDVKPFIHALSSWKEGKIEKGRIMRNLNCPPFTLLLGFHRGQRSLIRTKYCPARKADSLRVAMAMKIGMLRSWKFVYIDVLPVFLLKNL